MLHRGKRTEGITQFRYSTGKFLPGSEDAGSCQSILPKLQQSAGNTVRVKGDKNGSDTTYDIPGNADGSASCQ